MVSANQGQVDISAELRRQIHQLIKRDLQCSMDLQHLLKKEREVLIKRSTSELTVIVEQKTSALNQLDQHSQLRSQLLRQAGMAEGDERWTALIGIIDDEQIQKDWQKLLEVLSECRQCNSVNGKMIARGQQSLGRLLTLLRGQVQTPELYDHRGSPTLANATRTVIKI